MRKMDKPYYAINQPVQAPGQPFGRQTEVAWLADQLARGQRVLVIYGPPHIGKSTLLRQVPHQLPKSYLAVYLDADQAKDWDTSSLLFRVAGEVGRTAGERSGTDVSPPDAASFAQVPLEGWKTYTTPLLAQGEPRRLALLIDNADRLPAEWMHVLFQIPAQFVLTAESPGQLAARLPDAGHAAPSIALGHLNNEAAEALIKSYKPQTDPWAVRRILELTSNHPYYLRLFCRTLLDRHGQKSAIAASDVEETLQALLDAPMPDFTRAWERASPREKAVLSAFGALIGTGGIATQYEIQKSCSRHGRYLSLPEVVAALEALVQRGVLEKLGANTCRFTVELFRLWLSRHHQPAQALRGPFWSLRGILSSQAWRERFSRHWSLWTSAGVVLIVIAIVALQPALRQGSQMATATPSRAAGGASPTPLPTSSGLPATATATPEPRPTPILPGYDLLCMSRASPDAPWQIVALNTRTGQRLPLTETNSNERTPRWSPDGRRILFASDRDGNREVYVMDADGRNLTNLTRHKEPDWQPAWSPDGQRVAFSSYRDGNWEIYLVDAAGENLVRVTDDPESDFSPTWSPDGHQILFASRRRGDADLFTVDLQSGAYVQLTSSERDEYDPAWSPDGAWIAFVTQIGNQSDVFVMRADGSEAVNLTNSPYANDFQPVWTADSEWLIFVSYTADDGDHDLFRMRRDGSERSRVTDDNVDNVAPSLRQI